MFRSALSMFIAAHASVGKALVKIVGSLNDSHFEQ